MRGHGTTAEGFARAEAGWKFAPSGSVFGFGEASLVPGDAVNWQAGAGLRWNF